jgi:hypothetical protein
MRVSDSTAETDLTNRTRRGIMEKKISLPKTVLGVVVMLAILIVGSPDLCAGGQSKGHYQPPVPPDHNSGGNCGQGADITALAARIDALQTQVNTLASTVQGFKGVDGLTRVVHGAHLQTIRSQRLLCRSHVDAMACSVILAGRILSNGELLR